MGGANVCSVQSSLFHLLVNQPATQKDDRNQRMNQEVPTDSIINTMLLISRMSLSQLFTEMSQHPGQACHLQKHDNSTPSKAEKLNESMKNLSTLAMPEACY